MEQTDAIETHLEKNLARLAAAFSEQSDLIVREFTLGDGVRAAAAFVEGGSDAEAQRDLLEALLGAAGAGDGLRALTESVIPVFGVEEAEDWPSCLQTVLRGDTLVLLDGQARALSVATAMWQKRAISEPPMSSVLRGPREGFTEDLRTNLTQIRRRLQTPDLRFRHLFIGRYTHTDVAVVWIDGVADPKVVRKIVKRIQSVDCDGILDVNYLVEHLEEHSASMFQQTGNHEKPDEVTSKILEGRVAVMVNGSPIAVTLPFVLFEDFQQAEDYYTRARTSSFLRWIRVFGATLGIFLPGLYVAVQVFHASIVPLSYLYTIMNAVQGLPMTPLMEMIFVLLIFEILHEASFRMPKYVGMAMSVVGALVLGDTAVKAGLISSPSIMIVALSTIALYAIPQLVNVNKILRIVLTLLGGFAGLWGMALAGCGLLVYLAALDSYGAPYLAPFAPLVRGDLQDGLTRRRLKKMEKRPASFAQRNPVRRRPVQASGSEET